MLRGFSIAKLLYAYMPRNEKIYIDLKVGKKI